MIQFTRKRKITTGLRPNHFTGGQVVGVHISPSYYDRLFEAWRISGSRDRHGCGSRSYRTSCSFNTPQILSNLVNIHQVVLHVFSHQSNGLTQTSLYVVAFWIASKSFEYPQELG